MLKILFVGETWRGSSARTLRENLCDFDEVNVDDIGEDYFFPSGNEQFFVRGVTKLMTPFYCKSLHFAILKRASMTNPDVVIIYKGASVGLQTIKCLQIMGIKVVNVFPDISPLNHGHRLRKAIPFYDLVISAKPFHPVSWSETYNYKNPCVCVPHGYDSRIHECSEFPDRQDIDVVMVASARPVYEKLLTEVALLMPDEDINVVIAGPRWSNYNHKLPSHWQFPGLCTGSAYTELIRRGKIVIAPLHTLPNICDVDTSRTYELAAAFTFFLHKRTKYVETVYEEAIECDFWSDANELVDKIRYYLPLESLRYRIATAGHQRAVPAYSAHSRAKQILSYIQSI